MLPQAKRLGITDGDVGGRVSHVQRSAGVSTGELDLLRAHADIEAVQVVHRIGSAIFSDGPASADVDVTQLAPLQEILGTGVRARSVDLTLTPEHSNNRNTQLNVAPHEFLVKYFSEQSWLATHVRSEGLRQGGGQVDVGRGQRFYGAPWTLEVSCVSANSIILFDEVPFFS